MMPDDTTARYRACRRAKTHRGGSQRVIRDWVGKTYEMPVCDTCGVPITPKPLSRTTRVPQAWRRGLRDGAGTPWGDD